MKKYVLIIALIVGGLTACSDWLDVQPKTSIKGKDLFSSDSGFKDVLTGFYLSMGSTEIYAKEMTYGYLDLLAGNYDNYPGEVNATDRYDYESTYAGTKDAIYSKMYNIIANINNFLRYLDENRSVITTENYYEVMKGEALGLRAFLHFDLLRLFGPVYSVNPQGQAIPYRTTFDNEATPVLSAEEVVNLVLDDLHEADTLLEEHDSYDFVRSSFGNASDDPFLRMRMLRMNTYAVKAMLARVYCYKGDDASKAEAVRYAQMVIDADEYFALDEGHSYLNRWPEHIFSLNIDDFASILDAQYLTEVTPQSNRADFIMRTQLNFRMQFETEGIGLTDFRGSLGDAFLETTTFDQPYVICRKYVQSGYRDNYSGMDVLPLIRLPEMYYIIAECGTPEESASALNTVRENRGIAMGNAIQPAANYDQPKTDFQYDNTQTTRTYEVMKEYQKEYFSEGQLWFFYKRHNFRTFFTCPLNDVRSSYQWPLPDNETLFGNNN